jgi:glycosyltransferase involved in cell wall biosynthesis
MEAQLAALAQRLHDVAPTFVFACEPPAWLRCALGDVRVLDFSHPYKSARTLYTWLRAARARLVHFHFVRAYSSLVAAARMAGARVLVNDHVTLTRASDSAARETLKRLRSVALNPLCGRRIAVSQAVAESVIDVERVPEEQVQVIENGIDLDRFLRADGRAVRQELGKGPLIACVSRLSAEKGVESAIRMMPMVGRNAKLLLCGGGPDEARFREYRDCSVTFLGVRDDVPEILAASDVVVVPSHWEEAFGLAVVEGMAAGRPVVVTRSGAMPSIVGASGIVVPKRDPAALAGAVTRLLDDPLLSARLGRAARARARERYGMARFLDQVCALYRAECPDLFHELAA